jgi:DNA-binding NtrC family response regulator
VFGEFTYRSNTRQKSFRSLLAIHARVRDGKIVHFMFMEDTFLSSRSFSSGGTWTIQTEPGEMDGFELARLVHAARPGLPIILVTGHPDFLNGLLPISAGHYRLFKKPFDGQELLTAVSDALGAAG